MSTVIETDDQIAPRPATSRGARLRGGLAVGLGIGVLVALAGQVVPYVVRDTYQMSLLLNAAILSLTALGIGFLARHLGVISLGHGAFFGAAAYAVGIGTTNWGWSPATAVGFGILVGTGFALLMGVMVVRASGFGFLMLTLALSQALYALSVQTSARPLTGAYDGKLLSYDSSSTFLGMSQAEVMNPGLFWPVVWIALTVCATLLWLVGRSRFGTTLEGIRENEERMRFSGFDTFLPRLLAFVLSGAVASVGGALFAINAGYISPDILGFGKAGDTLIAALIGGFGLLAGPVVGTFLFTYAQARFNFGGNLPLFTGVALVVALVFIPGGITSGLQKLARRLRKARR